MGKTYTGKGDDGSTAQRGGKRVSKASALPHALGALDETNAAIGVARSALVRRQTGAHALNDADRYTLDSWLKILQDLLFRCGADIATPPDKEPTAPRITKEDLVALEQATDALDATLPELNAFILPAGTPCAASLHLARANARRMERRLVEARDAGEPINEELLPYVNRLSSYLFALARWVNQHSGIVESHPDYGRPAEQQPPADGA